MGPSTTGIRAVPEICDPNPGIVPETASGDGVSVTGLPFNLRVRDHGREAPTLDVKLNSQSTGIGAVIVPPFADPAISNDRVQLPLLPLVRVPFPEPATPETPFNTSRATEERLLVANEPLADTWVSVGVLGLKLNTDAFAGGVRAISAAKGTTVRASVLLLF